MAGTIYRGFILLFVLINAAYTERVKDMIYAPLEGVAACFRRHNGTNQFGCSSSRSGSVGVIHIIENEKELVWLEKDAQAGPYTAVVSFSMFKRDTLDRLKATGNINGVLLAGNSSLDRPPSYSPDDTCPNRYSGLKNCNTDEPWNPSGLSLLVEDWPFPMFYLSNQTQMEDIKSCFNTFNTHDRETQSERSLCALEMKSFMYSAVNSETCMRRNLPWFNFKPLHYCDPLGDRNIHWPLAPVEDKTESVIMVLARLDASSLFEEVAPGAKNTITGLVTLIATAFYLNQMKPTVAKTNVVFSLLNGEAFDYIGSGRLVYDLKEGNFSALGGKTLRLDQIRTIIELGQLGGADVYFHSSNFESDKLITELSKNMSAQIFKDSVPPASIQSFLAVNSSISATVIADHKKQFSNKYYNSILDDAENVNLVGDESSLVVNLNKIALSLANQLFVSVTGKNPTADLEQADISSMLECYIENANCSLFKAASSPGVQLPSYNLPLYVGVNGWPNRVTTLTGKLLALLTGTKVPKYNSTTCHDNHLSWIEGFEANGLCINATVNYSSAVSPAFVIDGYDMKSGVYSTWTESVWQGLSMRMFLKPCAATERMSMVLGSIVAIISFIIVWFIQSRSDILFSPTGTADC